ncbi:hypothetical protein MMG85_12215 [Pseudoxanthomonas sp. LH2527]|uniref:hypothetical protein n=1 Tax=Pseudoxanthomonas sp. LH2527 TaxID=2923249 RepID=UPI001F128D0B|nr:hypothetical protein [Pseudoxanthomonas sp. LH2527]MCH6484320.1 hypothetical protein [Pseudoxanthomonas sp. LH2527]
MLRLRTTLFLSCLLLTAPAVAQERVIPTENVRLDYAQVLGVEPVYQTLRATRTEQRCDEVPAAMPEAPQPEQDESRWSRMVDSVRGWFGADAEPERAPPVTLPAVKVNCRVVPIEREFQRPIAYDVDYIYKGVKYRSRLAEDPGNRLRIRISVVPYVAPAQSTASGP